jgi:hypothetical protein
VVRLSLEKKKKEKKGRKRRRTLSKVVLLALSACVVESFFCLCELSFVLASVFGFVFFFFFFFFFFFLSSLVFLQSGWLTKEGGGFKSWKKRYFWLKDGCLHYSKTKNGKDLGVIRLENATHIKPDTNARPKKKNVFEIPTPDRTYYLCADTQEDRDEWVALCQAAKKAEVEKYNPSSKSGGGAPKSGGGSKTASKEAEQDAEPERVGVEDFDLLTVIGKGSFGKVLQVRKRDNGKIFAMKVRKHCLLCSRFLIHEKAILFSCSFWLLFCYVV